MKVGHIFDENLNSVLNRMMTINSKNISVIVLSKIGDLTIWISQVREKFFSDVIAFVESNGGKVSSQNVVEDRTEFKFQFPPEKEEMFKETYESLLKEDKTPPVVFTLEDLQSISSEIGLSAQDIIALNPIVVKA